MHTYTDTTAGSFVPGVLHVPEPLYSLNPKVESTRLRDSTSGEYVLCHNDLCESNVIVNPETLKIRAILDWECAGFYPPEFDVKLWKGETANGDAQLARLNELKITDEVM